MKGKKSPAFVAITTFLVFLSLGLLFRGFTYASKNVRQKKRVLVSETGKKEKPKKETPAAPDQSAKIVKTESKASKTAKSPAAAEPKTKKESTKETSTARKDEKDDSHRIHTYQLIVEDVTWEQAYERCIQNGGYLVNFNTEEEYQHVINQIKDSGLENIKFWIGGRRKQGKKEYHWIDGQGKLLSEVLNSEPYENYWLHGEPSFKDEKSGKEEQFLNLFFYKNENKWVFNDAPNNLIDAVPHYAGTVGYICELPEPESSLKAAGRQPHEQNQQDLNYILPDSDKRFYSQSDIKTLSKEDLRLARNEIYARRGRLFTDQTLQQYFNQKKWYRGDIAPDKFDDSILNEYEKANMELIVDFEKKMGYQ